MFNGCDAMVWINTKKPRRFESHAVREGGGEEQGGSFQGKCLKQEFKWQTKGVHFPCSVHSNVSPSPILYWFIQIHRNFNSWTMGKVSQWPKRWDREQSFEKKTEKPRIEYYFNQDKSLLFLFISFCVINGLIAFVDRAKIGIQRCRTVLCIWN